MKFIDFLKKGLARKSSKDVQLAKSLVAASEQDVEFISHIKITSISARKIVSNYYDILRSLLEADAALNGYKIYSHEAFTYYLSELGMTKESIEFERFRKIRNSINYYGKKLEPAEAEHMSKEIASLIQKIRFAITRKLK